MPPLLAPVAAGRADRPFRPLFPVGADLICDAQTRLDGLAVRTPVLRFPSLDERVGAEVLVKPESLQRTGSFKFRGAYNHLAAVAGGLGGRPVLTTSSGNHAQAVALAGRLLGVPVIVAMPGDAPAGKRAATVAHGARIVEFDRYAEDREELTARLAARHGAYVLHAYDHELTMAGQATVAVELLEDAGELDLLVGPVGGGGLLGGCAAALAERAPDCRVAAVEPAGRPALRRALEAGEPVTVDVPRTLADGQQTASVGALPLAVLRSRVDTVVGVDDAEIAEGVRFAFERLRLVAEPSGACALAALLAGRVAGVRRRRVGVIVSGGNVDPTSLAAILSR